MNRQLNETRKATHTIPVELHPTAILWDAPRQRLYIANGNKDSVSVIDTAGQSVVRTITLQPFARTAAGIPTGAPDLPLECFAIPSRTSHVRFRPRPSFSSTSTMRRLCS